MGSDILTQIIFKFGTAKPVNMYSTAKKCMNLMKIAFKYVTYILSKIMRWCFSKFKHRLQSYKY